MLLGRLQSISRSHPALGDPSQARVQHNTPRKPVLPPSLLRRRLIRLHCALPTNHYPHPLAHPPRMRQLYPVHLIRTRRLSLDLARLPNQLVLAHPLEVRLGHVVLLTRPSSNVLMPVEVKSRRLARDQRSTGSQPPTTYRAPRTLCTNPASRSPQRRPQPPPTTLPTIVLVPNAPDVHPLNP